jgi:hypothetical protein
MAVSRAALPPSGGRQGAALRLLLVVVAALSACSTSPPLIADLPNNVFAARQEFDRRVRDRFPVGSLQADIERELSNEGFVPFVPFPGSSNGTYTRFYSFEKHELVCRYDWRIAWSADEMSRLTAIEGAYYQTCL